MFVTFQWSSNEWERVTSVSMGPSTLTFAISRAISLNLCRLLDGIDNIVCDQVTLIHGYNQNQLLKKGNLIELPPGSYQNGLVMTQ